MTQSLQGRGPVSHHIIVRLADEGVPVAAIARAVQRPAASIWPVLQEAIVRGQLTALPPADWPPTSSRDCRVSTAVSVRSSDLDALALTLQRVFILTAAESRALALLLQRAEVASPSLHLAISGDSQTIPKTVDVIVHRLRRKLAVALASAAPDTTIIETLWGRGYALTRAGRAFIHGRLLDDGVPPRDLIEVAHAA